MTDASAQLTSSASLSAQGSEELSSTGSLTALSSFDSAGEKQLSSPVSLFAESFIFGLSVNVIAHYNVAEITDPLNTRISQAFSGPYQLEQSDDDHQPLLLRDPENGVQFLRFDAERGDFMRSASSLDARSLGLTILALVRIRDFPIGTYDRSPKRVGTLLRQGTARSDLFRDFDKGETELQLADSEGTARFKEIATEPVWRLYAFSFTEDVDETAYFDEEEKDPFDVSGNSLLPQSTGTIDVGYWTGDQGYLDADVAEILILRGRPSSLELLDLSTSILERQVRPSVESSAQASLASESIRLRGADVELGSSASMEAKPTADPGDIEGSIAWFSSLDSTLSGSYEDGDPVATWENISETTSFSGLEFSSRVDKEDRPTYESDLYNELPGFLFPREGVASTSPDHSNLSGTEYTIYLAACNPVEGSKKCLFEIENQTLQIITNRNSNDPDFYDLTIVANPNLMSERKAYYAQALPKAEFFELFVTGRDLDPYDLEVYVDGTLLTPDEKDTVINLGSPIEATVNNVTFSVTSEGDIVTTGIPHGSLSNIAADLFYETNQDRNFKLENDGAVVIGDGTRSAYLQVAWYDRALSTTDRAFIRQWFSAKYPTP